MPFASEKAIQVMHSADFELLWTHEFVRDKSLTFSRDLVFSRGDLKFVRAHRILLYLSVKFD